MKRVQVVVIGVVLTTTLTGCGMQSVQITNDTHHSIRLSGCTIDDALDLLPGQSASVDASNHRQGCSVYDADYRYVGCLAITSGQPTPLGVYAHLNRDRTDSDCQQR